jgi:predicted RNA-binding Zn-ribbon protein involved in translation (DUF1610 family)
MARVKCPKCNKVERILKAGIVRNKQRYFCKDCNYHFIISNPKKTIGKRSNNAALQTSMQDIAEAAGVSTTTVSRALNNRPDIHQRTCPGHELSTQYACPKSGYTVYTYFGGHHTELGNNHFFNNAEWYSRSGCPRGISR